jgi:hypothetical protein
MRIRLLAWACIVGLAALLGPSASSAVDLTGSWIVTTQSGFIGPFTGTWDFLQSGTVLSLTMIFTGPQLFGTNGPFVGVVDSATGAFHFDLPPTSEPPGFPPCPNNTIDGTVSPDGTTISGNDITYFFKITPPLVGCNQGTGAFAGSRCAPGTPGCCAPGGPCCGDLIVEPGEECDGGSCCSATCQLEPSGTTCGTDSNVCTDDVCDGAGTCQHVANSASCGTTCQPATCVGGSCMPQGSAAPGTPCDADADPCTVGDACNAAGTCVPGPPLICPTCELCDPSGSGCVARPIDLVCQVGTKSRLRLVGAADPSRHSVRWQWARQHVASDPRQFRDPLTESDYDLCVYDASGLVLRATVPAGGQCGPKACWQQKATGFAYRDRAEGSSGVQRINLVAKQSATAESVEGNGPNVDLPASLAGVVAPLRIQLQAHDAQGISCWEESYDGSEIEIAGTRLTAHH